MITNKKIGVLMGGASAEREVSLKTGEAIYKALKSRGYEAVKIDAKEDTAELIKKEKIEAAFIALHGGCGEDGSMQGLLEVIGIPYTGSGVLASALAMDKEASKKMFVCSGLPVPEFDVVRRGEEADVQIAFPRVVKPAAEGSSIGVAMADDEAGYRAALKEAMKLSDRVLVEKRILGREIQVGVLGGRVLGSVEVRPSEDFYSYEAKYTAGKTEYILPPEVDKALLMRCEETGLKAHKALGCRGASRVDLMLDSEGVPYVLEVNTIPGMTETSLLPKIARLGGLEFADLVEAILREALAGK